MINVSSYKFYASSVPIYFNELYKPASNFGTMTRRSRMKLLQPSIKTNHGKKSLSFIGPKYWNTFPQELKLSSSVNSFKHNLKKHFFTEIKTRENSINI